MKVKLLAITPKSEQLIEYAGRVCWHTELSPTEEGMAKFIRALIKRGHLSVIEHASATFEIDAVSRSCTHQLVRHRLASYSQESMRYVDMSDQTFKAPPSIIENDKALKSWLKAMDKARETYQELRELGIPRQDSRFVLPIATTGLAPRFEGYRHPQPLDQHFAPARDIGPQAGVAQREGRRRRGVQQSQPSKLFPIGFVSSIEVGLP